MNPKRREQIIIIERSPKSDKEIRKYTLGALLGVGGFAKVYEVQDQSTHQRMAGKIIPKANIRTPEQKSKLVAEISIHKSLKHPRIVKLERAFEDKENIYMMEEKCKNKTMFDYLERRGRMTEAEVQYYLSQLLDALRYLHEQGIVHRDIKLKNLFLTDDMDLKLGDFGLAVKLKTNERRFTICGTHNYIAPEIISKAGHSYQADMWSVGVLCYTMLVGRLPFDDSDNKVIYKKILENKYVFPADAPLSYLAKDFIMKLLVTKPEKRLNSEDVFTHPFIDSGKEVPKPFRDFELITNGFHQRIVHAKDEPKFISPPKYGSDDSDESISRSQGSPNASLKADKMMALQRATRDRQVFTKQIENNSPVVPHKRFTDPFMPRSSGTSSSHSEKDDRENLATEVCVVKWLDYASKYGIGYVLSDGSLGIIYNDSTRVTHDGMTDSFAYFEPSSKDQERVCVYSFNSYPNNLERKVNLYYKFKDYLENNLSGVSILDNVAKYAKGNSSNGSSAGSPQRYNHRAEAKTTPTYVRRWSKTKEAIFFKLNNKIMQVVFKDEGVIILNTVAGTVEYIDPRGVKKWYKLNDAAMVGDEQVADRVRYTQKALKEMRDNKVKGNMEI